MADPIVPPATVFENAFIQGVIASRPSTQAWFNNPASRYATIPPMYRAQALRLQKRIADEVAQTRLASATGPGLRSLCTSEYNTTLPTAATSAAGYVLLARSSANALPAGQIQAGSRWVKAAIAQPNLVNGSAGTATQSPIPVLGASYSNAGTINVPAGATSALVPIAATGTGSSANVPRFASVSFADPAAFTFTSFSLGSFGSFPAASFALPTGLAAIGTALIQPSAPLFDPNFTVVASFAAGGSDGLTDPQLAAAAGFAAPPLARYGTTTAYLASSVAAAAPYARFFIAPSGSLAGTPLAVGNPVAGLESTPCCFMADASWASTTQWIGQILGPICTSLTGFGGAVVASFPVLNQLIAVSCNVFLRSSSLLMNTTSIDANVRAAAQAYFDAPATWAKWTTEGLADALTVADPNILYAQGVLVTDPLSGFIFADATSANGSLAPTALGLWHYYLTQQNVSANYLPPPSS